jgi:hypothetical protein
MDTQQLGTGIVALLFIGLLLVCASLSVQLHRAHTENAALRQVLRQVTPVVERLRKTYESLGIEPPDTLRVPELAEPPRKPKGHRSYWHDAEGNVCYSDGTRTTPDGRSLPPWESIA